MHTAPATTAATMMTVVAWPLEESDAPLREILASSAVAAVGAAERELDGGTGFALGAATTTTTGRMEGRKAAETGFIDGRAAGVGEGEGAGSLDTSDCCRSAWVRVSYARFHPVASRTEFGLIWFTISCSVLGKEIPLRLW